MHNDQKDNTLSKQTVSKLLDFESVPKPTTDRGKCELLGSDEFSALGSTEVIGRTSIRALQRNNNGRKNKFLRLGLKGQKKLAMLVPVLSVVLIFVLNRNFGVPSLETIKFWKTEPGRIASNSGNKLSWINPLRHLAKIRNLGSMITIRSEGSEKPVVIKGILYSSDNPSAIINGQAAHQGDKLSDVTILKINRDSIEFERDGKKWIQKVEE